MRPKQMYVSRVKKSSSAWAPTSTPLWVRDLRTGYTTEVAHFRYFVSETRCSFTPNRQNVTYDFGKKKRFVDLGHGIIRRDAFRFLLKSVCG